MACKFEILPVGSQQRKTNIKTFNFCLRDRPEEELSEQMAAPCISVLVSDFLLHLGICEGFQKRAPLVSIPRVANSNFHSRQRVLAARQGRKQHPSVVPEHSSGLAAQMQDTRTTAHHSQCFRLKYSFLAPLRIVWFPEVHQGLMVTILLSLKFLGDHLLSPLERGLSKQLWLAQLSPTKAVT